MRQLLIRLVILLTLPSTTLASYSLSVDYISDSGDRTASLGSVSADATADANGIRLRLGLDELTASRGEIYLSSYDVDEDGEWNEANEIDLGINYIATFGEIQTIPFLKVGIGLGIADTDTVFLTADGDTTDNIRNFHFNLGGGASYLITDNVGFSIGIEYIYRVWQEIDMGIGIVETDDSIIRVGAGLDFNL